MKKLPAHLVELNPELSELEFSPSQSNNKYGARRTFRYGIWFDSAGEADRYDALLLLQRAGEISNLAHHVKFDLRVNDFHICYYECDFQYCEGEEHIVEDFKSKPTRTPLYQVKKKLMYAIYKIKIRETE